MYHVAGFCVSKSHVRNGQQTSSHCHGSLCACFHAHDCPIVEKTSCRNFQVSKRDVSRSVHLAEYRRAVRFQVDPKPRREAFGILLRFLFQLIQIDPSHGGHLIGIAGHR